MPTAAAPTEHSAGGLVIRRVSGVLSVLLIMDGYGNWGFPKGHLEEGENSLDAAKREIAEETGIAGLSLKADLQSLDWYFRKKGRRTRKICDLYLFEVSEGDPTPQGSEGISRAEWVSLQDARKMLTHENTREALRQGCSVIEELKLGGRDRETVEQRGAE